MIKCIRRLAKEVLAISSGGGGKIKGAWRWNEEVKEKVREKQDAYTTLIDSIMKEEVKVKRVEYKVAKKIAKNAITVANNNAFERLYQRLRTKGLFVLLVNFYLLTSTKFNQLLSTSTNLKPL